MKGLNMLDDSVKDCQGMSYVDFLAEITELDVKDLRINLAKKLGVSLTSTAMQSLDFLGFFSDDKLQYHETTPFEITSDRMIKKMFLSPVDRDMVVLQHIFLASYPDGNREVIKSSMIDFGSPLTNTSIARTVALPAAIAVKMILEKKIEVKGVCRPVIPQIYNPVLDELKTLGVEMKEEYGLPESEMIQ
jgi:saccharopine dehydrogenase-like NADP-dependent oxidoreductase